MTIMEVIEAQDFDGRVYRKRTRKGHRFISIHQLDETSAVETCGHKTEDKAQRHCDSLVRNFDYAVSYVLPAILRP
jgi:hypothetical protein